MRTADDIRYVVLRDGVRDEHYYVENLRGAMQPESGLLGGEGGARVGRVDARELHTAFSAPWNTIEQIELDAGASIGPRLLDDAEVSLYVISGELTLELAGRRERLRAGMSVVFMLGETLHLRNTGRDPAELVRFEMGVPASTS